MKTSQKSVLMDHEEQFAETFEYITKLIDEDKINDAVKILSSLHFADLADFLDNTNHRLYKTILPFLVNTIKPDTLVSLSNSTKQPVLDALGVIASSRLINRLSIEDAIEVIDPLEEDLKNAILKKLPLEKKHQIIEGFTYPEDTVGRILERNFVFIQESFTIAEAVNHIKQMHINRDFYAAIVVDSRFRPTGSVLLSTLLKHPQNAGIKSIMTSDLKIADANTPINDIAFLFKQYALTVIPVVNRNGRLIGTVSIQNMLYIIEEQAEREIMHLSGVQDQDIFYNLFSTVKHRFPWLFVNLITAFITSTIINQFSDTIAKLITIAVIMPIVASMSGNAGTQAMTITIRALAHRDITNANMFKVISKEILVCGVNGFILALAGIILTLFMLKNLNLSIIFAVAVIINFLVAGFLGSVIPITLHNLNIDPATASGVFLTALTDAFGFFTFLALAYAFIV